MANDSELLTLPEASAMLRLRPSTLRAWVLRHKVTYIKLGSRLFFRRRDLEALIVASEVHARQNHDAQ